MSRNYKRRLERTQERDVALTSLCGINPKYVSGRWNISEVTRIKITDKYSSEWKDPLIEIYRKTSRNQRLRNSAHLYLSFHGKNVDCKELVDCEKDSNAYDIISKHLYIPIINRSILTTSLDRTVVPTTGLERILERIFGRVRVENYVESILVDRLHYFYQDNKRFYRNILDELYNDIANSISKNVKNGVFGSTKLKADIMSDAFKVLNEREKEVLRLRFEDQRTLKECAEIFGVSYRRIRGVESSAIKKLTWQTPYHLIKVLEKPLTDQEILECIKETETRNNRNDLEEKLDLNINYLSCSIKVHSMLKKMKIHTIKDIIKLERTHLLKIRGFGMKSLQELESRLSNMGLSLDCSNNCSL